MIKPMVLLELIGIRSERRSFESDRSIILATIANLLHVFRVVLLVIVDFLLHLFESFLIRFMTFDER